MPRPDYDRFLSLMDEKRKEYEPFVALHYTYSNQMPFLITRVSDIRYRMIGEYSASVPELGVFVDVYPIDGMGNDERNALAEKERVKRLRKLYYRCHTLFPGSKRPLHMQIARQVYALFHKNPIIYLKAIESECTRYSYHDSDYVACPLWESTSAVYLREGFDSLIPIEFEGFSSFMPSGYDDALRRIYGDYMQLPPEEERVPSHCYSITRRI